MSSDSERYERRFRSTGSPTETPAPDARTPGQIDRDRVLYTSAFRRLAGVTQVAGAAEGHVYHNRLTHTLEVAQLARRLAERLRASHDELLKDANVSIDADVAEAAALAHDLGHPPFGHVAEKTLQECIGEVAPTLDSFEGNAQSFRILTRLSAHRLDGYEGLNLTRATLNAVLKYPWLKGDGPKHDKWGAYRTEDADLLFARTGSREGAQSLEAAIMDHADAVAYSVHDLDDFFRAGLVPLGSLHFTMADDLQAFKESPKNGGKLASEEASAIRAFALTFPVVGRAYTGRREDRKTLRTFTSVLIGRFLGAAELVPSTDGVKLQVDRTAALEMRFLQNLVWRYVIDSPALASQQHGQKKVVAYLFDAYFDAVMKDNPLQIIPPAFAEDTKAARCADKDEKTNAAARLASDVVSSFTDEQAYRVYARLTGTAAGSVTDRFA